MMMMLRSEHQLQQCRGVELFLLLFTLVLTPTSQHRGTSHSLCT